MIRILRSNWMAAVIGILLYWGATLLFLQPHLRRVLASETVAKTTAPAQEIWNLRTPELDELAVALQAKQEALRKRAQQLDDFAARLKTERQELLSVTQTVDQLRANLDQTVVNVRSAETANLKRLAKVYANMSPDSAAAIFQKLTDEQAVKILMFMRDQQTAGILESLSKLGPNGAQRAAALSNRLRLTVSGGTATTARVP